MALKKISKFKQKKPSNSCLKNTHPSSVTKQNSSSNIQKKQTENNEESCQAGSLQLESENHLSTIMTSGPFPLVYDISPLELENSNLESLELRNYDCKNYQTCFALVAALDWDGFSCQGCSGELNQHLLWRAQGECSKDAILQTICELPSLRERNIKLDLNQEEEQRPFSGLRLVVDNSNCSASNCSASNCSASNCSANCSDFKLEATSKINSAIATTIED